MTSETSVVFYASRPGLEALLGELESAVMEVLWKHYPIEITTRVILGRLRMDYKDTTRLSSVNTTLGRLEAKGWVNRRDQGEEGKLKPIRCWYQATLGREEFIRYQVHEVLNALLTNDETEPSLMDWLTAFTTLNARKEAARAL